MSSHRSKFPRSLVAELTSILSYSGTSGSDTESFLDDWTLIKCKFHDQSLSEIEIVVKNDVGGCIELHIHSKHIPKAYWKCLWDRNAAPQNYSWLAINLSGEIEECILPKCRTSSIQLTLSF